jgi:beta-glucosidase
VRQFPDGFLWGVSTSAYQVEGAVAEDGRGVSIWDVFSHTPGKIDGGGTGDVACDHYHRWREDLDLIGELGANAYRFSLAWPRIQPDGRRTEQRGLDHYDRLIDGLLERNIEPIVTLYHWDLPRALEDDGGWLSRDTVDRFAEYAKTCFDAYGDRVRWWVTINEPWIVGLLGYRLGLHAPGAHDVRQEVRVFHHLLLAHGRAARELNGGRAGIAFALAPHYPWSDDAADVAAARESDGYVNRFFLDGALRSSYPDDTLALFERVAGPLDFIHDGDLATVGARSDFIGVNYYARRVMRSVQGREPYPWEVVVDDGVPKTEAGTEITPEALTDLLMRLHADYGGVPLLITENGCVYGDAPHDARRADYLDSHLAAVHAAVERGAPVVGYCHWSLLDNFEWALGYAQRFGLVHVDYETQSRTIKDSGRHYGRIARRNAL